MFSYLYCTNGAKDQWLIVALEERSEGTTKYIIIHFLNVMNRFWQNTDIRFWDFLLPDQGVSRGWFLKWCGARVMIGSSPKSLEIILRRLVEIVHRTSVLGGPTKWTTDRKKSSYFDNQEWWSSHPSVVQRSVHLWVFGLVATPALMWVLMERVVSSCECMCVCVVYCTVVRECVTCADWSCWCESGNVIYWWVCERCRTTCGWSFFYYSVFLSLCFSICLGRAMCKSQPFNSSGE